MDDRMIRMMQLSQSGYSCGQVVMQLALDMRGEENQPLIRAMAGLAYGCGFGRGTCGALTGCACVLALYAAGGAVGESESDRFMPMMEALSDWFSQTIGDARGGIRCESITGGEGGTPSMKHCGQIVSDSFAKTIGILAENGFDLTG